MEEKKKNWFLRHKIWTVIIVLFGIGLIGSFGQSNKPSTSNNNSDTTKQIQNDETEPTQAKQTDNQNTSPVSNETVSQKNAVAKAKSYLKFSAFSHDGLVAQLEFDQFSNDDAVYGADNSGADWNEQAAKKAEAYMKNSAFSRGSLIDQLKFDKFTQEQAEYGADAVGL